MDLFQHRYYKFNKTLMTLIGQWPYQSTCARRSRVFILISLSITQIIPVILALGKHRSDRKILLDSVLSILFITVYAIKFIGLMWNSQKVLKLLNRIRMDWPVWAPDREVEILCKYSERGEKLSVMYTATIYSVLFVFMTQPVISKIINVLSMNGTEPGKFPFPVEYYYLDMQKYYFYIVIYSCLCLIMPCMVIIASDVMLITNVQHGCGIFAALGYSNLLENSYRWTLFFIIGVGVMQLNLLGLQILVRESNSEENIKFITFLLAILFMFIVYTELSEILLDHSISIRFHIHNSQWYRLSCKAQKLLQFMMMRSSVPCQLTAGKIFILHMRTFIMTMKTALSYFMVVRSMQSL